MNSTVGEQQFFSKYQRLYLEKKNAKKALKKLPLLKEAIIIIYAIYHGGAPDTDISETRYFLFNLRNS